MACKVGERKAITDRIATQQTGIANGRERARAVCGAGDPDRLMGIPLVYRTAEKAGGAYLLSSCGTDANLGGRERTPTSQATRDAEVCG